MTWIMTTVPSSVKELSGNFTVPESRNPVWATYYLCYLVFFKPVECKEYLMWANVFYVLCIAEEEALDPVLELRLTIKRVSVICMSLCCVIGWKMKMSGSSSLLFLNAFTALRCLYAIYPWSFANILLPSSAYSTFIIIILVIITTTTMFMVLSS